MDDTKTTWRLLSSRVGHIGGIVGVMAMRWIAVFDSRDRESHSIATSYRFWRIRVRSVVGRRGQYCSFCLYRDSGAVFVRIFRANSRNRMRQETMIANQQAQLALMQKQGDQGQK